MPTDEDKLIPIRPIGHDVSIRGEGLSMREALVSAKYSKLRAHFGPAELTTRPHPTGSETTPPKPKVARGKRGPKNPEKPTKQDPKPTAPLVNH
ncbi:MAG: hypothetical protein ACRC8S_17120, partial [Fimbriiglobus sp.]